MSIDVIIIGSGTEITAHEIAKIMAECSSGGKTVLIHNPQQSVASLIHMAAEMQYETEKLLFEVKQCKDPYDYYFENEPNDIQPFTESRRNVSPIRQHVIWDYG